MQSSGIQGCSRSAYAPARFASFRPLVRRVAAHAQSKGGDNEGKGKRGFFDNFFDFESWAPRSSRIWRLNQYDYETSTRSSDEDGGWMPFTAVRPCGKLLL